jgi:hypothetical protein
LSNIYLNCFNIIQREGESGKITTRWRNQRDGKGVQKDGGKETKVIKEKTHRKKRGKG